MRSLFAGIALTLTAAGWICAARGAEFTAAGAEARAVRSNPDLASARPRIEEARGRLTQAGRMPNPELQIEAEHKTNFREGSLRVGLMQKFPATEKLRLEKEVSQSLVAAAEAEVRIAERQVALNVRALVIKALALDAQNRLREKQQANAKELAEFASKRAEAGEIPATEAAQFQLEAQQIEAETLQLAVERQSVTAELRLWMGLDSGNDLTLKGTLGAPGEAGAAPQAQSRPEVLAAQHSELAAHLAADLEKARRRDDISAGLFAGIERTEDAPEGLGTDGLIGVRVSIPLPFWNKNEGKIQEAAATASRMTAEREALAKRIKSEAEAAEGRMRGLRTLLADLETKLLPQAEALESKVREFYAAGNLPLTDVLRARDRRLQLERTHIDALRDYHLARAAPGIGL